jgi:Holliday junction resolvase-like predicted endonuclease
MAPPANAPTAMAVLASEQLWPNIHGLVHWQQHLQHLCIYHTSDTHRSAAPARRLAALCAELYPGRVTLHLPQQPAGIRPEDVRDQLRRWRQELPGHTWVVNVSGGNKLMYAGAVDAGGDDTMVVYRDLSNAWYVLRRRPEGVCAEPLDVPPDATDAVPVEKLIRGQWSTGGDAIEFGPAAQPLPVLELTRAGLATAWDWRETFRQCGFPSEMPGGMLFEAYVAAVLLELGVTNLARGVRRRSATGDDLQEIDIVANHGGRLAVVDCKLRSEEDEDRGEVESITSQIRQAAHTRRELGGLGADLLLLRPGRPFSPAERALAEASGLSVVGASDARQLFNELGKFVGCAALPPSLQEAGRLVASAPRPFAGEPRAVAEVAAVVREGGVADLDAYMHARDQDWIAYRLAGELRFWCANPARLTRDRLTERIAALFNGLGEVFDLETSKTRRTCWFNLRPAAQRQGDLHSFLEERQGRSLLGSDDDETSRKR